MKNIFQFVYWLLTMEINTENYLACSKSCWHSSRGGRVDHSSQFIWEKRGRKLHFRVTCWQFDKAAKVGWSEMKLNEIKKKYSRMCTWHSTQLPELIQFNSFALSSVRIPFLMQNDKTENRNRNPNDLTWMLYYCSRWIDVIFRWENEKMDLMLISIKK